MSLSLRKLIPYTLAGWLPGGRRQCVLCGNQIWRFMPYRKGSCSIPPLMKALDIVGSDVDQFECPRCGGHDRERHLLLYLRATGLLSNASRWSILHFAPERRLSQHIAGLNPIQYVRCDLYPVSSDIQRIDMQAMPFEHDSFDLLMANHVLEHVSHLDLALQEIYRVLKPGGYAILQTPYSQKLESTWEDAGIATQQARLHAYGQEDHVRLFGRDIFERIAKSGLEAHIQAHLDVLETYDANVFGVNSMEPLFLFRKR